ncbi:MAG TPA: apolipoprotein N-acyltransferase [Candidatus Limnocylindria bacterium]|nr:apolipoprotein N-acyltransferase [Candidatus Limnocylindria bacterium]
MAATDKPGRRFSSYLLPILSGILVGTSYIPFPPWALFFCLVPLWLFWLREGSWKRVLFGGWLAQFVVTLVGFHWVAHTAHEFGHLPWPVAVIVLLLFCAVGHLFIPLTGLLWALFCTGRNFPRWAKLGLLPAATALCWHSSPMIFPWNLGYAWLWGRLPAYQLAEFAGFTGLSALTIALNLAFLVAWENRKTLVGARVLGGALAFLLAVNALGWMRGRNLPPPDAIVRVLVVQANIGNLAKERAERGQVFREEILEKYFALTERGWANPEGSRPDFVLWPESAYPDTFFPGRMDSGNALTLREFLSRRAIPLATGARGFDEAAGKKTNAFFLFDENGEAAGLPYHKSMLLAFGEYMPGARIFPALRRWFPRTADFARGNGPGVKPFRGLVLGPQICYEGLFPGFSRQLADQGAQVFVNVTNDSWFGTSAEPYQHLAMTLARGIEFRRPVVRATNTGISTVMLADGTILDQSPLHREWFHRYDVPYRKDPPPTFYQKYGFLLLPIVLILAVGILLTIGRRGRQGVS